MSTRQLASAIAGSVAEQASVSAAWRRASALRIACQTVPARWRLRQRRASRVLSCPRRACGPRRAAPARACAVGSRRCDAGRRSADGCRGGSNGSGCSDRLRPAGARRRRATRGESEQIARQLLPPARPHPSDEASCRQRVGRGLERLLVGAPAPPGNPLFESGERAYLLFPILNILVPQVGQTPCVAGLPFFIVMAFSSFIVRIVRHLIQ